MPRSPINHPIIITQGFLSSPKNYPGTGGHPGVDIRSPLLDDWFACVPGVYHIVNRWYPIKNDRSYGGYGRAVCLDWGQAEGFIRFLYGHGNNRRGSLNKKHVKEGVYAAESGNTGKSTAPHLHFEMRYYKTGGKFWDGTLRLRYDLLNPLEKFFDPNMILYTYK